MIFWQASQEVEEDIALGRSSLRQRRGTTKNELRYAAIDINCGMFFSNLVMYFIILTTAATLFVSGHHTIQTAADAAKALVPFAGRWSEWLLALGMIGMRACWPSPFSPLLPHMFLAGAFGWKEGLSLKPERAPQFYGIIAVSTPVCWRQLRGTKPRLRALLERRAQRPFSAGSTRHAHDCFRK